MAKKGAHDFGAASFLICHFSLARFPDMRLPSLDVSNVLVYPLGLQPKATAVH